MALDLIVFVLAIIGLLMSARSSLWKLLFRDGIIYFVIAFSANLTVAVFVLLNLNPIMDVMFFLPAACIAVSAATRSFIQLDTYLTSNTHVQSVPLILPNRRTLTLPGRKHSINHRPGVHLVNADRDMPEITWTRAPTNLCLVIF